MPTRALTHDCFTLERHYDAAPARVFRAFADPASKRRWFACDDAWEVFEQTVDFREGGREVWRVGPPAGPEHRNDTTYFDIVPNERLVWSYAMSVGDRRISVSFACVELRPEAGGTRLVITEHGVFLDGHEGAAERERGTHLLLDNLGAYLRAGEPAEV